MPDPMTADPDGPLLHEALDTLSLEFAGGGLQSRMRLLEPCALDLAYTRTMMGFLLWQPAPRRVVMIGLGGGSLAKFCHRHLKRTAIEVVENNPQVIALRGRFRIPRDSRRFAVVEADGAQFVRSGAAPCEVLLVD